MGARRRRSMLILRHAHVRLIGFQATRVGTLRKALLRFNRAVRGNQTTVRQRFPRTLRQVGRELPPCLVVILRGRCGQLGRLSSLVRSVRGRLADITERGRAYGQLLSVPNIKPLVTATTITAVKRTSTFGSKQRFTTCINLIPGRANSKKGMHLLKVDGHNSACLEALFVRNTETITLMTGRPNP